MSNRISYIIWLLVCLLSTSCNQSSENEPRSDSGLNPTSAVESETSDREKLVATVLEKFGNPLNEKNATASSVRELGEKSRALLQQKALATHARLAESNDSPVIFSRAATVNRVAISEPSLLPQVNKSDQRVLTRVVIFDYQSGTGTELVAQLLAEDEVEILSSSMLTSSGVPITAEEEAAARALLKREVPAYDEFLGKVSQDSYDLGFFHSGSPDPGDERFGHRLFLVRPVFFKEPFDAPNTIIDLSTDEVVSLE